MEELEALETLGELAKVWITCQESFNKINKYQQQIQQPSQKYDPTLVSGHQELCRFFVVNCLLDHIEAIFHCINQVNSQRALAVV